MRRTVIIDADAGARQATAALINRLAPNLEIETAATVEAGWTALERAAADLVIVDPAPYGQRGTLLLHLVHEQCPAARLMVLTVVRVSWPRATQWWADTVVEKPVSPRQLQSLIAALLPDTVPAGAPLSARR